MGSRPTLCCAYFSVSSSLCSHPGLRLPRCVGYSVTLLRAVYSTAVFIQHYCSSLLPVCQVIVAISDAIDRIRWRGGGTRIGQALDYAERNQLRAQNGYRSDAQTVVVVLTDGRSVDDPSRAAERLRARGVIIYAIGLRDSVDRRQLRAIAGDRKRMVTLRRYDQLNNKLRSRLAEEICIVGASKNTGTAQKCKHNPLCPH